MTKNSLKIFGALVFVGILLAGCASTRSSSGKNPDGVKIKAALESRDYTISANRAIPHSGRAVPLTSDYSLRIKGDSIYSYLPYFGRAYSLPYGGGEGLIFNALSTEYTLAYNKKGAAEIGFNVKTGEDNYSFNIEVFDNGSSSITVQPNNKQSISFTGELRLKETK